MSLIQLFPPPLHRPPPFGVGQRVRMVGGLRVMLVVDVDLSGDLITAAWRDADGVRELHVPAGWLRRVEARA